MNELAKIIFDKKQMSMREFSDYIGVNASQFRHWADKVNHPRPKYFRLLQEELELTQEELSKVLKEKR